MSFETDYTEAPPSRAQLDALAEPLLIEFGAPWCGVCRGAQGSIRAALEAWPGLRHLKVEDGPGRRLGRSFGVRLWPTLVLVERGAELARVVRPADVEAVGRVLQALGARQP